MTCPCCGTPTPASKWIEPLGIQMERVYSKSSSLRLIGEIPSLIPWRCPGARHIDTGLLRFGVIALSPWSCGAPRSTGWNDATRDLRHRAIEARVLQMTLDGWI